MKKSIVQRCDNVIMYAIFAVLVLHVASVIVSRITYQEPVEYHAYSMTWAPFFYTLSEFVLALVLLWKAYRLGACTYTKIAVWLYILLIVTSIICIFSWFDYSAFQLIMNLIFVGGTSAMLTLFAINKFRHGCS